MISCEQAKKRIADLSDGQVRALTVQRLAGENQVPVGSGYFDEASEDLVIQLLRSDDLGTPTHAAVVAGCREVYGAVFARFAAGEVFEDSSEPGMTVTRVSNVADATSDPELRAPACSLLRFVLDTPGVPPGILQAVVRGALAYVDSDDQSQVSLWEAALKKPEVCAYAFRALLLVDSGHVRVERALKDLWRRQLDDAWAVDTPFLLRLAARERGSERIIGMVLGDLRAAREQLKDGRDLWDAVVDELQKPGRRTWTRDWAARVRPSSSGVQWPLMTDSGHDATLAGASLIAHDSGYRPPDVHVSVFELYTPALSFRGRHEFNKDLADLAGQYGIFFTTSESRLKDRTSA